MKMNFVTLFNSNYLSRGITMYNSLLATNSDFHLYIVAFDDVLGPEQFSGAQLQAI